MDIQLLFNFEQNMEDSFKEYLLSNGLTDIYTSRDVGDLPDNSIILQFSVDNALFDHVAKPETTGTGQAENDQFGCTLSVDICTDRTIETKITGYKDLHAFRKALIRKLMMFGCIKGTYDNTTALSTPYYNIYEVTFASDTGDQRDQSLDGCILQYTVNFQIIPAVWRS